MGSRHSGLREGALLREEVAQWQHLRVGAQRRGLGGFGEGGGADGPRRLRARAHIGQLQLLLLLLLLFALQLALALLVEVSGNDVRFCAVLHPLFADQRQCLRLAMFHGCVDERCGDGGDGAVLERRGVKLAEGEFLQELRAVGGAARGKEVDPLLRPMREAVQSQADSIRHDPLHYLLGRNPTIADTGAGAVADFGTHVRRAHEHERLPFTELAHTSCCLDEFVLRHLAPKSEHPFRVLVEAQVCTAAARLVEIGEAFALTDRRGLQWNGAPVTVAHYPHLVVIDDALLGGRQVRYEMLGEACVANANGDRAGIDKRIRALSHRALDDGPP
mmetsp:Transcript_11371/g.37348  ORF Transcript_11371/g.37348 Transcript_11371/m.37348 type:complete len:332 (-) Transcript_11371:1859-2854(-)